MREITQFIITQPVPGVSIDRIIKTVGDSVVVFDPKGYCIILDIHYRKTDLNDVQKLLLEYAIKFDGEKLFFNETEMNRNI